MLLVGGLDEAVVVPEALTTTPHIIDDSSGYASLAVVVVELDEHLPVGETDVEIALKSCGVDVSIVPDGCGVVGYLVGEGKDLLVPKLILATALDPLRIEGHSDPRL